jgi:tetratricopeptide (TPR) repeat protein
MRHTLPSNDAVDLLHQALDAIDLGRSTEAMHLLKHLLLIKPGSAEAHYLLGTEQAKSGMTGRAVASLRTALAFDPKLDAARFRLGVLLMADGQLADAKAMWQPLNTLYPDDPFYLFKTGLLLIAEGQPEQGITHLLRGLAQSHINTSLNADMTRVITEVRATQRHDTARSSPFCPAMA